MNNYNDDFTPNHGGSSKFEKKKHFGFDKETNSITFRILPQPKGVKFGTPEYSQVKFDQSWHRYVSGIFGFKNSEGKLRVFESPQVKNNKTKMVDVPCAATDLIKSLKGKLEEAIATKADPAIISRLNQLVGMKGVYNIDTNQHMNVMLLDGSIGELKLRHKAFVGLKAEIDKLRAEGCDPVSLDNGRFFTITRTVNGRDTVFTPSVYKEKIKVEGLGEVEKTFVHAVIDDVRNRLETEGFNLDAVLSKLTSDEVAQVVQEADLSTGKSPACDRFFDARWKAEREARKAGPTAQAAQTTTTQTTGSTQILQTSAPMNAQTTAQAPAAILGTNVPTVTVQTQEAAPPDISALPDDEFWKTVGINV